MARKTLDCRPYERLYRTAEAQQGYFTARQAALAGIDPRNHPYHVQAGNWVREGRGIYRLALFPPADRPDLVAGSLWSMNRKGVAQGAFSHETALSICELSDAMPHKLHMTVPPGFRRSAPAPNGLVLHRGNLDKADIESRQGYRVTTPLRTLADLAQEGRFPPDLLRQAVREAVDRGLLRLSAVRRAVHLPAETRRRLEKLISEAGS
ncbi:MAG: type IV toxin-antitoxin system AbiEi family antitoxin domain-containing protein [Elusimicrobiota bacterium]